MIAPDSLLLTFTIPATPVAKGRARSTARVGANGKAFAKHYTPAATRNFEAMVKDFATQAMRGAEPMTAPVDLLVEFRFRIPPSWPKWQQEMAHACLLHHTKKPDCSNLIKAIEDAMNGVVWADDGQVVGSIQDKIWTRGAECIVVHVFRRAGFSVQASRSEAMAALQGYRPDVQINHLPLGRRMRNMRPVT